MEKEVKAKLCKKISKNNKEYYVVEIELTSTYVMSAFPTKAEVELIKSNQNNSNELINNNNEDVFANFK